MSTIEEDIQAKGLTAPRITPVHIESRIAAVSYHQHDQLTICIIELVNGYNVTGTSACASPENFDQGIGQKIARANAVEEIWALEGYILKQALYQGTIEQMAKMCHDVNRAYCQALGDYSQVPWEIADAHLKLSATNGVMFHVENPNATPSASHENWATEKYAAGWVYGKVKDATIKTHPCLMAFDALPVEQQAKDFLFRQTVHSLMEMQG
tara:strand:- start:12 stop:644 length:633 start_codon:yes stop_codon:yes gene_type:complete